MTRGTNKSIYKFKFTNQKDRTDVQYFFTGQEIVDKLGFPRCTIYYSLNHKDGILGQYKVEKVYIPKTMITN